MISSVEYRIKRASKVLRATLALRTVFPNLVQALLAYVSRQKWIRLTTADGRGIIASRSMFLQLVSLSYFHSLIPIGLDGSGRILYNDGLTLEPLSKDAYWDILRSKGWSRAEGKLQKGDLVLGADSDLSSIFEIFEQGVYDIEVSGRQVIDIGSGFGDSAIYFALRGAAKVIAFEPIAERCQAAIRNIALNPTLANRIEIRQQAVISSSKATKVEGATDPSLERCPSCVTLAEIIPDIKDPFLLKIDCEGCEYDLIESDTGLIRQFQNVIFEFHPNMTFKPPAPLFELLGAYFDCAITHGDTMLGVMRCIRRP